MSRCEQMAEAEQTELTGQVGDQDNIVRIERLTKRYGDVTALSECCLNVGRGEVFGLLGPNGAGKTTMIRLMMGFLQPSSGRCLIDGFDPLTDGVGLRERVAYLPGDVRLPRHMRGGGVLKFFADIHPFGSLQRSQEVADRLELQTRRRVGSMSTGMRQKLALSVVLGLNTPLLILDEPTANLDPTIRASVLDLVLKARDAGRTVMFSSHVLSEIEDTCDRVAFLRRGILVRELAIADLFQRHRITALPPACAVTVPAEYRERVTVQETQQGRTRQIQINTAGDLAPLLPWVASLSLEQMRIEPLGLRVVYDSVHNGAPGMPANAVGTTVGSSQ